MSLGFPVYLTPAWIAERLRERAYLGFIGVGVLASELRVSNSRPDPISEGNLRRLKMIVSHLRTRDSYSVDFKRAAAEYLASSSSESELDERIRGIDLTAADAIAEYIAEQQQVAKANAAIGVHNDWPWLTGQLPKRCEPEEKLLAELRAGDFDL